MTPLMKARVATALRPYPGERVSGDAVGILEEGPIVDIAVVDGLGHGPEAGAASAAFVEYFEAHHRRQLESVMQGASDAISGTRGAAATLVRVDCGAGRLAYCGVGNVELKAKSTAPIHPVSTPGIVGRRLRKTTYYEYPLTAGDLVVIHTDGISTRFDIEEFEDRADVEAMARAILLEHGKHHDDASCVVIGIEE
jgi:phosphoserine phosphatase RsbX